VEAFVARSRNRKMKITDSAFQKFACFVTRIVEPLELDRSILEIVAHGTVSQNFKKGDYISEADQTVKHLFFINSGLIRYYYLDERSGGERTGQFFDEDSIYTDMTSFVTQLPSRQFIQALEPSEIVSISRKAIYEAYASSHAIERFGRLMLEQALIGSQRRTSSFMNESVEERYRNLMDQRKNLARRVPQYILASYLGVTPEALSRIRRKSISRQIS
jgi:CRP-like cAMP-binding protein